MEELKVLVQKELRKASNTHRLVRLCNEIFAWYDEGGERLVKERIDDRVKGISADFRRQAEDIKILAKLKKPKKRRR
jgi:hypothetical protein